MNWQNVTVKLGDLRAWDRNPKTISKSHAERLLAYWNEIGQFQNVAIGPANEVYDGHQRLSVLLSAYGPGYQVDARRSERALTEDERKKLVVAAHVGTTGQFDWDELASWDAAQMQEWGLDAEALVSWGSDVAALREMLESEKEEPPEDPGAHVDKAEELREKWGVESGQLWKLGDHRIICGDCTDPVIVSRLMDGKKANLIVTDPPYGVNYEGGSGNDDKREKLRGDDTTDLYPRFLSAWMSEKEKRAAVYIWFAGIKGRDVFDAVEDAGLTVRALIVWNKIDPHYGAFMAQYMQKHEPCLYCVTPPADWYGPTNEVTVWDIKQPSKNEYHPTEKPIECMERPIRNSSKIGDIVSDPFSGSGTTLIACERLSRKCRAVEISPAYVAVAIQRWVDMTGGTPELIESGASPTRSLSPDTQEKTG